MCLRRSHVLAAAAAFSSVVSVAPLAAEPAVLRYSDDWTFDAHVYAFLPLLTWGTTTVADQSADLEMDLGEVLEVLDFAISGRFEAWKGDWGLLMDANYYGISGEDTTTLGGPLGLDLSAEVGTAQGWVALMAGYRLAHGTNAAGRAYSFDIAGGARYNTLTQDIDVSLGNRERSLGGTEDWWEAVVAARGVWEVADGWAVTAMVDAGGFGAGGNDLAWSATVGADWQAWDATAVTFGWRYYDIDFETERSDGTFAYNVSQHGPYVGLRWVWN